MVEITSSNVAGLSVHLMDDCPLVDPAYPLTEEGYLQPICRPCWTRTLNCRFHRQYIPRSLEEIVVDVELAPLIAQMEHRMSIPSSPKQEQCEFYERGRWDIQLSAKTEFFHPFALRTMDGTDASPAERVLELFNEHPEFGRRVRFLSKQDYRDYLHLVPSESLCGVSMTTLTKEQSKEVQPGAADPATLIKVLQKADRKGLLTWAVAEPFYDEMNLVSLLEEVPLLQEIYIGRLTGTRTGYPVPSDLGIIKQVRQACEWAEDNAPKMRILMKKQLWQIMIDKKYWNILFSCI